MISRFAIHLPLALALLGPAPALSNLWNVYADGSGDAPTIQAAIDSAAAGDTILLHDGIYTGSGNKNLDFGGKNLVLRSDCGPEGVIIDCENVGRGIHLHSGEGSSARIERITIRNGYALEGGGGGIRIEEAWPMIRECVIEDCIAGGLGAGGGIQHSLHLELRDCRILRCSANNGGGIAGIGTGYTWLTRCTVAGNSAGWGGGVSTPDYVQLDTCLVTGNRATTDGGGVYAGFGGGYAAVTRTTIAGNRAERTGGGMFLDTDGVWVLWSIFWDNSASLAEGLYVWGDLYVSCAAIDSRLVRCQGGMPYYNDTTLADPLFCDPRSSEDAPTSEGDYSLDAASPCLSLHACGRIGALGEGCDTYTGVAAGEIVPARALGIFVSPNPAAGRASVRWSLPSGGPASVSIYDVRGRVVRSFAANGREGTLPWDGADDAGRDAPPGIYFLRISGSAGAATERLILVR